MKTASRQPLGVRMGMIGRMGFFLLLCLLALPGFAPAQEKYPAKSINFIIGYPAGGTTDLAARPLTAAAS